MKKIYDAHNMPIEQIALAIFITIAGLLYYNTNPTNQFPDKPSPTAASK